MLDAMDLAAALQQPNWREAVAAYEVKMLKRGFKNASASLQSTHMITNTSQPFVAFRTGMFWTLGWIMGAMRFFARR